MSRITPPPKRAADSLFCSSAGSTIEPMPTTVATDEPEMAANSAQATTPARSRPPYQCPISEAAKSIMRRGTTPVVVKISGQDKERDRHDLEAVDAGEEP